MEPLSLGPEIRELTLDEIQTLAPDFEPYGLPDPRTSMAVGIVRDGKVLGYQFVKLMVHVQPTKLDDSLAHLFSALCRKTEEIILQKSGPTWCYVFAKPGRMAALCESRGMEVEPWVVMSKLVKPELPARPVMEMLPIPTAEVPAVAEISDDSFEAALTEAPISEPDVPRETLQAEPVTATDALKNDYKAQFPVTEEELEQYPGELEAA